MNTRATILGKKPCPGETPWRCEGAVVPLLARRGNAGRRAQPRDRCQLHGLRRPREWSEPLGIWVSAASPHRNDAAGVGTESSWVEALLPIHTHTPSLLYHIPTFLGLPLTHLPVTSLRLAFSLRPGAREEPRRFGHAVPSAGAQKGHSTAVPAFSSLHTGVSRSDLEPCLCCWSEMRLWASPFSPITSPC